MKKKLEALVKDSRLAGNAVFERLNKACQLAGKNHEKAKSEKANMKSAYRKFAAEEGRKDRDSLLDHRLAFVQAKYMQWYHRAAYDLAEYRLSMWLENWVCEVSKPHEAMPSKQKKVVKKVKKAAKPAPASEPAPVPKKIASKAKSKMATQP